MREFILLIVGLLLFVSFAAPAKAGIKSIWAVNDGEKVKRDDLANPNKPGNSVWDGRRISLFAARNEVVAFQLIVEADDKGISALRVALPELKAKSGGARIAYKAPGTDPTNYVGREIEIFTENYMNVTKASKANWVFRPGTPAAPTGCLGWMPVQLVDENAKAGKGGFPISVAPRQNQAVWIDVYTKKDLPAGLYSGTVKVSADGATMEVPVELEVFDFTLPDENSLPAMVYYEPTQPELYQGQNLDDRYHRFAHRNRVELVHRYDEASATESRALFTGDAFTPTNGYEGPGEKTGNRIIPLSFYGPIQSFSDRKTAWQVSDAWMTFLKKQFPKAITFMYMPDEPGRDKFSYIRTLAENIHSNPGPGGKLPVFITTRPIPDLSGQIDVWCAPVGNNDVKAQAAEQALGHEVWVYNGGRPGGGAIIIDSPATDSRATIWACFKHNVNGYFYWHGDQWLHNEQMQGNREQNVWANPVTFNNVNQPNKPVEDQGGIMGDGVLMYPESEVRHPQEDRGILGPSSTIQLANFRRGLQDHQYLTIARKLGLDAVVDDCLGKIVPKVFSEAGETVSFPETGNPYEEARHRLAVEIAKASKTQARPAGAPPATK